MRKIYLIVSGALLGLLPASSQTFERHPGLDAEVIFHQDFEVEEGLNEQQAYDRWSKTPIDTIRELEYYAKTGTGTPRVDIYAPANVADWSVFLVRKDSTSSEYTDVNPGDGIVMFNGADPTSSADEIKAGVYKRDVWKIVGDNGLDPVRIAAFNQYGEDGGKYYFQWETAGLDGYVGGESNKDKPNYAGKNWSSQWKSDTHSTAKHRRDLYVRGLNIEDESSYRLTFFIKTTKLNTWGPKFYADVMRGYHHQRAAFSMGYKSGKEYSLEMSPEDFEDNEWQKVTLMTYYINDHEADGYVIYNGSYSWDDDWTWRPSDAELAAAGKTLAPNEVLNYVKQPDKFFVRLSCCTDSVIYSLDNLSLTKSWIGGCEYDKDKMRVDFGYQTNLSDLVKAEKEATNIPIVEVPDLDGKYFEVWCLKKGGNPDDPDDWEDMPIRSAEYHDDGYMYMFTDYVPVGNEMLPLEFEDYDQVLVTFHNPTDKPEMTLKYTGSYYPKPLDSAWVAQGKIVPDFFNEIATPNPTVFGGVVSKDALPPVMMKAPYEDGSFGLDADTRELRFKFSREVQVDDALEGSLKAIAYVGTEVWKPTWDSENSQLVITRPEGKTTPLKGDYKIELVQILDKSGGQGDDVVLNYHFGDFTTTPSEAVEYTHSDWRSTLTNPSNNKGCLPLGTWTHCYVSSTDEQFAMGDGEQAAGKVRLYVMDYTDLDNCGYYLASRNTKGNSKAKYSGNIFTIINFTQAGGYSIKFKATGWDKTTESSGVETHLYLYPKPSGNAEEFTFDSFTNSTVAATKTDLGSIDATTYLSSSKVKDVSTGKWPDDVQTLEYTFNIATPGDYVFEWCIFNGSSSGLLIGNYTIGTLGSTDLSTPYVKKLNNAIAAAQDKLNSVVEDKYKGSCYEALGNAITQNQSYKGNYPSKYDSIVAYIGNCVNDQKLRMDTVDLFYTAHENAVAKLAQFKDDMAKYINLSVSQALSAHITANADYVCQTKTTADLTAQINAYKAEIKAVDDRMALNEKLIAKINEANALANAANRRQDYPEYATLVSGLETAQAFDDVNSSDKAVLDAIDALADSQRGYVFKIDYYLAKTRQMKELFALADKLGYDFAEFEGGKEGVATLVNTLQDDDAQLTKALREASILQILKKYKENKPADMAKLDSLDVSALMNNYFLYNEADSINDMEKNDGVWRIKKDVVNTTAIPGWTITPTSGNWYPIKTKVDEGDPLNWSVDGHVFYGSLRCDTRSKATLVNVVEGLPEGYYMVGVNGYNNTSDLYYDFKTDSVHYNDRLKELNGGNKWTYYAEVSMDSVLVVGDLVYTLDQQSSSSGLFDLKNAVLRLHGRYDLCDYDAAITAQEAKMAQIITVVDAPAQETEGVQYFNLSGVQINNPKSGEIIIRRIVRNGKVVVDKVLIK